MAVPGYSTGSVNSDSAGRSSASYAFDSGVGANRTLVVGLILFKGSNPAPTVSSLTYNGVALTQRATVTRNFSTSRNLVLEIWTLDNPASGSNTLAVTYSHTLTADAIISMVYTGANNGVGSTTWTGSGSASTVDFTPTNEDGDGLNVSFAGWAGGDTDPFTSDHGVTERFDGATGTHTALDVGYTAGDEAGTGGGGGFTASVSDNYVVAGVEILSNGYTPGGAVDLERGTMRGVGRGIMRGV